MKTIEDLIRNLELKLETYTSDEMLRHLKEAQALDLEHYDELRNEADELEEKNTKLEEKIETLEEKIEYYIKHHGAEHDQTED